MFFIKQSYHVFTTTTHFYCLVELVIEAFALEDIGKASRHW